MTDTDRETIRAINYATGEWETHPVYDRSFLEFVVETGSQYDLTCRKMAAQILKLLDARQSVAAPHYFQKAIWDAINHYAETCGGDTGARTATSDRMDAVVQVEALLREALAGCFLAPVQECSTIAGDHGLVCQICHAETTEGHTHAECYQHGQDTGALDQSIADCHQVAQALDVDFAGQNLEDLLELLRAMRPRPSDAAIPHEEAIQIALTYIAHAFKHPQKPGRALRHSIPANPATDTDLRLMAYLRQQSAAARAAAAQPLWAWHEGIGDVLWWRFPIVEPPYVGSPLNSDWPGYHTHWTTVAVPQPPEVR